MTRSILIVGLLAMTAGITATIPSPRAQAAEDGFTPLFNGKSLAGWWVGAATKPDVWGAGDGVLFVQGGGGGWLMHERELSDFELSFRYKMPKGGNSGVCLRAPLAGDPAYQGMEIQLIDEANWKGLRPTQLTGSIYDVIGPSKQVTKPFGEWNAMRIVCKGRNVKIELNGTPTVDADLDQFEAQFKKHPGLKRTSGHIGFQSYNLRVEFADIAVKPL